MDHRNNFQISGWTVERVALLRKIYGTKSVAEVAREIGSGVSRNAVIGKAGRLGLSAPKEERPKRPPPMPPRPRPVPSPPPPMPPPPPMATRPPESSADAVHLLELRAHQCRWLIDEAAFLYCGAHCDHGSYCPHHAKLSYRPHPGRREHQ